jgi:hypothetical protein
MSKLLAFDANQLPLELRDVLAAFHEIPKMGRIRTAPEVLAAVEGEFGGNDRVIVRLISTCKMLSFDGPFDVVVRAVIEVQRHLEVNLHVIDEGYNFDIDLHGIQSDESLKKKIEEASLD